MYMGLNCSTLYSFFSLFAYLLINFFEKVDYKYLYFFIVSFISCVVFDGLVALGYFYQGIHFLILSNLIYFFLTNKKNKNYFKKFIINFEIKIFIIFLLILLFLISPWAFLFFDNLKNYSFDMENSRLINPLSINEYFQRSASYAPLLELPYRLFDFVKNNWEYSWLFIGFFVYFFIIYGLIFYKNNHKWIYVIFIFFLLMLNFDKDSFFPLNSIHIINSISNPFNFLVRSFHMTSSFLISFALLPLLAFGLKSFIENIYYKKEKILRYKYITIFIFIIIPFFFIILNSSFIIIIYYILFSSIIILSCLYHTKELKSLSIKLFYKVKTFDQRIKKKFFNVEIIVVLFTFLFLFELFISFNTYFSKYANSVNINPYLVEHVDYQKKTNIDFQNPSINVFRHYYSNKKQSNPPGYIQVDPINNQGLFYRYTNLKKYFDKPTNHQPRHISFEKIYTDDNIKSFLQQNEKLYFFTNSICNNLNSCLEDNKLSNLNRDKHLTFDSTELYIKDSKSLIKNSNFNIYEFDLPNNLNKTLASTIFTNDKDLLKLKYDNKEFNAVQGKINWEYEFDIRNINENRIFVSIPKNANINLPIIFEYINLNNYHWVNPISVRNDFLEFNYISKEKGRLIFLYPHDNNFSLIINGKKSNLEKIDIFMDIPVQKGTNTIVLKYNQNFIPKILYLITGIFSSVILLSIIIYSFLKKPRRIDI